MKPDKKRSCDDCRYHSARWCCTVPLPPWAWSEYGMTSKWICPGGPSDVAYRCKVYKPRTRQTAEGGAYWAFTLTSSLCPPVRLTFCSRGVNTAFHISGGGDLEDKRSRRRPTDSPLQWKGRRWHLTFVSYNTREASA